MQGDSHRSGRCLDGDVRIGVDSRSTVVESLLAPGRRVHREAGRRLLDGRGLDLMVMLDLGNSSAHSLGRRQAWLGAISIAVAMDEEGKTVPETTSEG